jgi:putative transposase
MYRCLRIQPSGFYAWLKVPLSKRTQEYQRQTALLTEAWIESGKVYGHRKLHDDLTKPASAAPSCPPSLTSRCPLPLVDI